MRHLAPSDPLPTHNVLRWTHAAWAPYKLVTVLYWDGTRVAISDAMGNQESVEFRELFVANAKELELLAPLSELLLDMGNLYENHLKDTPAAQRGREIMTRIQLQMINQFRAFFKQGKA